jgi:ADP-L-glycero-D-manno-heptose 6-epimerase
MIIVTGGAGFIGSNLVHGLNKAGHKDILVVDDLTDGTKFSNIVDCKIRDYWDKDKLKDFVINNHAFPEKVNAMIHQGACSTTTEWDGRYMMENNYEYSKIMLHYCLEHSIPFIYASSGSVYGINDKFTESEENESPVNMYGYSKYLFDMYVRRFALTARSRVIGLRYFNVYGPREQHKKSMASVTYHFNNQLLSSGIVRLFKGSGGYEHGEQRRDFIHVDDVINVNLWCMENSVPNNIYNVGTGRSHSFNDMANAVIKWHGKGRIEYIDFPAVLENCYQSYTQADISALLTADYSGNFISLADGVNDYLDWLNH